ncbi:MAG: N-acetylneuraminate synthase [Chloroflexales bacterium]
MHIDKHHIGPGLPCFIIAEAGVNHNGSLKQAQLLIDAAVQAGADAVKFQTFKAESLVTAHAPKAAYQREATGVAETQLEMLQNLELSLEDFAALYTYCASQNILFMSTPFDRESADFLAALGMAVFKIPSGELTNLPFLTHVARLHRPMIVSTGMARLSEVDIAFQTITESGNDDIALLHCVSSYPAAPEESNLRAMATMGTAFGVPIGFSDHTLGTAVTLAAVALGACIIEKHITLDRNLPGPDHRMSLEPHELSTLVREIRQVEVALGHGHKIPADSEADTARAARRSLVAEQDIPAGVRLTDAMIAIKRPGGGLLPSMYAFVLGRTTREPIARGTLLRLEMLS